MVDKISLSYSSLLPSCIMPDNSCDVMSVVVICYYVILFLVRLLSSTTFYFLGLVIAFFCWLAWVFNEPQVFLKGLSNVACVGQFFSVSHLLSHPHRLKYIKYSLNSTVPTRLVPWVLPLLQSKLLCPALLDTPHPEKSPVCILSMESCLHSPFKVDPWTAPVWTLCIVGV